MLSTKQEKSIESKKISREVSCMEDRKNNLLAFTVPGHIFWFILLFFSFISGASKT